MIGQTQEIFCGYVSGLCRHKVDIHSNKQMILLPSPDNNIIKFLL